MKFIKETNYSSLKKDDIIIIFNDIEEVISYLKDQISNLKRHYKYA
mgnify:CR=1 FL=1